MHPGGRSALAESLQRDAGVSELRFATSATAAWGRSAEAR